MGSIPAQAGEPAEREQSEALDGVYPRAGGGTHAKANLGQIVGGLSPRRRGNRPGYVVVRGDPGSIPAQAGEPRAGSP